MLAAGLPVPPGFAVTTDAFETLRAHADLRTFVAERLAAVEGEDPTGLRAASTEIRRHIEAVSLPAEVDRAIRDAYDALSRHCGVDDVPVAVRSSATAEDLPDASFAGEHDTYLWVRGGEAVTQHVRRCWSSLFTDRAIAYRRHTGHDHEQLSMSVGVQKMIEPRAAGVAFTLNPTDGDRSQIAIDAAWGFGEAVVGGEVTPDNFVVDKVLREIVSRTISPKTTEYRLNGDTVERATVDDVRCRTACLTDDEIQEVAAMARRAEQHYGCPQDVEWAIDRHLPDGENVVLLQSRPETVWSTTPRRPIAVAGQSPLDGVVRTLISGVHTRGAGPTPTR
ncbi:MAG: PEP/pyruvate-binding domain-containing protein [Actinobacteria bacterium]|nr:PEP/pyruvate-binding domain-containing protein [Actinomycetota bacterium]